MATQQQIAFAREVEAALYKKIRNMAAPTCAALYSSEKYVLDVLNIRPTKVTRISSRIFDFSLEYEAVTPADPYFEPYIQQATNIIDGVATKSSKVVRHSSLPDRTDTLSSGYMLLISLAYCKHVDEVCSMFWGPKPWKNKYGWDEIRKASASAKWALFEQVTNRFFVTPALAACFAQPD